MIINRGLSNMGLRVWINGSMGIGFGLVSMISVYIGWVLGLMGIG